MPKAVFLDRDGTIVADAEYLADPDDLELLPGAGAALARLQRAGFLLALVTNQSGVGRGYFPESAVRAQQARLAELLQPFGVTFAATRYCPHHPDAACACRKPKPGMLLDAGRELRVDFGRSWMIGDKPSDVEAGRAAGCRTVIVAGQTSLAADFAAADLAAAAELILAHDVA
jgi:D-glycero-D-manno-heptose 1,7-bisphosphate phosphatase